MVQSKDRKQSKQDAATSEKSTESNERARGLILISKEEHIHLEVEREKTPVYRGILDEEHFSTNSTKFPLYTRYPLIVESFLGSEILNDMFCTRRKKFSDFFSHM